MPLEIFVLVRNSFIRKKNTGQVDKKAAGLTVATQHLLPSLALETL